MRRYALLLKLRRESLGRPAWCGVPLVLGGIAALLLLAAAGRSASAAALTTPSADIIFPGPCGSTIQQCLDTANTGDTLIIQPDTYNVALTLNKAINLTGVSSGTVILHGLPNQRVLTINDPTLVNTFVISGLTFTGGSATGTDVDSVGAGVFISIPIQAQLVNVTFFSNTAKLYGGGLFVWGAAEVDGSLFQNNRCSSANCFGGGLASFGSLVMNSARVISNSAAGGGSGALTGGQADISNSLFQDNICTAPACQAGGLGNANIASNGPVVVNNTQFISNSAMGAGGGMYSVVPTTVDGGLFQDNHCSDLDCQAGALFANQNLALTGARFLSNSAQGDGGALNISTATIGGALFQNNQCVQPTCHGGGVYAGAPLTLADSQFVSDTAGEDGGGVYAVQAVALTNVQFTNNQSGSDGGALYALGTASLNGGLFQTNRCLSGGCGGGGLFANTTLTLDGTQFVDNSSQGGGGGLEALHGATLNRALFQSNHGDNGGGLFADDGAALTATVFLSNTAIGFGGGFTLEAGDARVVNSLFAGNTAGSSGRAALTLGEASSGNDTILFTTLAGGPGAGVEVLSGTLGITDSIISGYTIGISVTAGTGRESHNLFFANGSNTAGAVTVGGGSLTADPKFVNPAGGDYHLMRASPAIDLGVNQGVTTDIDGDHRPQGAGFDVGFDEYLARLFLSLVRR